MWNEMFSLGPSVAEKMLRAIFIYAFLLVALRVGGKRELAQLKTMDFIVLLTVANAVQNGIIGDDNSVTGAIVGGLTLFGINGVAAFGVSRSRFLRRVLVGSRIVLIQAGVVNDQNLRRLRLTKDDLLQAVMEAGGTSIGEVEFCEIEPNGHLVVTIAKHDASAAALTAVKAQLDRIEGMLRGH